MVPCQKYLTLKNRREKIMYIEHKQIQTLLENDIICGIKIIPKGVYRNRKKMRGGKWRIDLRGPLKNGMHLNRA